MNTIDFKLLFLLVVATHISFLAKSQQTPLFSEYNYNPLLVNPAYAGMTYGSEVTFSNYGYFNAIEGSPKNSSFTFNTPIADDKMGLGATISRDKVGVTTNTTAYVAYSYKIFFGAKNNKSYIRTPNWQIYNNKVFSFGMTAGVRQLNEDLLELGIDNDPEFARNISATLPTIGVGFLYNTADFYVGLSAPNLLGSQIDLEENVVTSNPLYGYVGCRFFPNYSENTMIKPSALIKYEAGAPVQLDANISLSYRNIIEIGTGYRSTSSLNFLVGLYAFNHVLITYQHNARFNNSILGNSHGIIVTFKFDGFE
ncbi:type IX secretion system PorP/SprF family membrane protein [Algoriphagus sp. 4150]|uniref:PorP/SprF family type IX secretion system membrane protein n=1 Tax=Algoriphagus sp. 4150 TaxID=2817756 RepID=UPI0028606664|nr:PorP/SprF family type IX secretion system membrane protein [Algoriphagus sp. 4150]MDR7128145.1 type IX secretion system PorP/SprF family membrane protein [Algoriphagus sp. 4150]